MAARPPDEARVPARVVVLQPRVQHYRLPVFDRLAEAGRGRYALEVWGTLRGGEAFGGGRRDYLREHPLRSLALGSREVAWWPGVGAAVRRERPAVVVSTVQPSYLTSWLLPGTCRAAGAVPVGWTKVQSPQARTLPAPLRRRFYARYASILAYGSASREELRALGYPPERVFVTNNTIDTDRAFSEGERWAEEGRALRERHGLAGKRVLLCVARMEPLKRHADLLDAWPLLRGAHPDLHLVLVGGGSLAEQVRRRAEAADPERIHFVGTVPEGMDYGWIAASDATVQCGGVGLAINISMAFGRPTVIADERGPDTEALVHGETGFRYPRGDIRGLAAAVALALSGDPAVSEVSARAREKMRGEHSIGHMVEVIHRCLTQALASRPGSAGGGGGE